MQSSRAWWSGRDRREAASPRYGFVLLRAFRIATQHAQEIGQLPQMAQRVLRVGRVYAAQEVYIKEILPRFAAQGPRFDFGEIQVAQGERAQRPEQRARNIAGAEHQRSLPLRVTGGRQAARGIRRPPQKEKTGEIPAVAFN